MKSDLVAEHGVAQFGFEPGAFGRHDAAGIGNVHQVFDAGRKHGKGAGKFAAIDELFQFRRAANAADEGDAFAGARVFNAENRGENMFLKQCDVQVFDGIPGRHIFVFREL